MSKRRCLQLCRTRLAGFVRSGHMHLRLNSPKGIKDTQKYRRAQESTVAVGCLHRLGIFWRSSSLASNW